ncbi:MAG: Class SAM-dependent methyltransferase [Patescibacteria group bacterium]|nr:Class SAM-dependent methyltransferase [Patescibacteria group bacterium]
MKKDLKSYERHNKDYVLDQDTYYSKEAVIKRTEDSNMFKSSGFELAFTLSKKLPETHIDIGSGVGWLTRKTAPLFKHVIGIEPSTAAVSAAKKVNDDCTNVSFVNKDMVDGLVSLNLSEPVFVTTGAVLSHIEDYYVEEFLKRINDMPIGSNLFFSENYDKNMHWKFWHIRNKDWWRKNLPNWQLIFLDLENSGYASGIFGLRLHPEDLIKTKQYTLLEKTSWKLNFFINLFVRFAKKIKNYLLFKK